MRMRRKPNLEKRLDACVNVWEKNPSDKKGEWKDNKKFLYVEFGCGKGSFTCAFAKNNQDAIIVAIEKVQSVLVLAMEKIISNNINNVRFISGDVTKSLEYFDENEVDKCCINFCDPWPKSRDAKLRLTAPNFLRKYATILKNNGIVEFRTDNRPLFDWSVQQFTNEGWELVSVCNDSQNEIRTDYETKFMNEGIKINTLIARKVVGTKTIKDGEVPRLRNSALSDARGYLDSRG